jgi:hypothetical protein
MDEITIKTLMEIKADGAYTRAKVDGISSDMEKISARLAAIEQLPAKRLEAGKIAAITGTISTVISAIFYTIFKITK